MSELVKVKPETLGFDEIMLNIRTGKIRVPDFQREFVWELKQIARLLDSIYNHYPIGSLLFWQSTEEIQSYRNIGEVELQQGKEQNVHYVLDGQQRLTSLFACLEQATIAHHVNGKKVKRRVQIYFDLDEGKFVENPFEKFELKEVYKRQTINSIPFIANYFDFLSQILSLVESQQLNADEIISQIYDQPDFSTTRSKRMFGLLRDLGLYREVEAGWVLSEEGKDVLQNRSVRVVLSLLWNHVAHFDNLLPKLLEVSGAQVNELSTFLSEVSGEKVSTTKVSSRLKWLDGIGVGRLDGNSFELNETGRGAVREVCDDYEEGERNRELWEEEERARFFSVKQITDINSLVEAAANLEPSRREALMTVQSRFRSYPFSVIHVVDQPIEIACEIFERINNSGKVLNVVDLMVAKSWTSTFNLRERLNEFRRELTKERFEIIPDITVIQCMSAILKRGIRRKDILEISRNQVEKDWERVLECIRQSIDFIKSELKVTNAKLLPFNVCIVPLAYYFSLGNSRSLDAGRRKILEQWFWRAAISNRYNQAVETKMSDDLVDMARLASDDGASFDYTISTLTTERIREQKLNLGSAFCKALLCIMNYHQPREFMDGRSTSLNSLSKFNSVELHHIFPQAYLKKFDKEHFPDRDCIANIALVRASANKDYSSKAPSKYLARYSEGDREGVLSSHLIDARPNSGLFEDDYETFIAKRSEALMREVRRLTGAMTEIEADFVQNEVRAIDSFEHKIRDFIDSRLRASHEDYWSQVISSDLKSKIDDRIAHWLAERPGRKREDVRRIDFCQMFDYFKIIKSQWSEFEDSMRSKSTLEQYFKMISNFRNALVHSREIDNATRQLALGALTWFEGVFEEQASR
jgi:hypothetical protein